MVTRARLTLADHIESHLDELCESVLAAQKPIYVDQSKPFMRAWLQSEAHYLRGEADRTHEWVAMLSEEVRALGGGIEEILEQVRVFRDAVAKACAGKVQGLSNAELLEILLEQQDRHHRHIGAYWAQRMREDLAAQRRRQRVMADLMDRPFVMLDAEGAIMMANHPFARELGMPMESLNGREFATLCDPDTAAQVRRALRQKRSTQPTFFEGTLISAKNRAPRFRFSVQPIFDAHGRRDGVLAFMRHMCAVRSENSDLLADAADQIIGIVPTAIEIFDRDRRVLYRNNLAAALPNAGETPTPFCCRLTFAQHDRTYSCPCGRVFATGETFQGEGHIVVGAKTHWYHAVIAQLHHSDDAPMRLVCMLREITTQRMIENQLMRQQQSSLASQLAVTVAHQLRNPLGVMVGFAEMLARGLPPEHIPGAVNKVLRNGLRCKEIVEDLLRFGQGFPGERVSMDFHALVKEFLQPMIPQSDCARITWELPEDQTFIECVPGQISQVFFCLLQNAIQAGAEEIHFTANCENGWIVVRVQDDGPGVPPELREVIFQPFFSTGKHEGALGLGLSLSQAVVNDYGGRLYLEETASGACFVVQLPHHKTAAPIEDVPLSQEPPVPRRRLLVVDDELDLLEMLEMTLEMRGYQVDTTGTAAEALELLQRIEYDAVVLDIRLPGDMSGSQLYEFIAAAHPDLAKRSLFITADTMNYETRKFLEKVKRPAMEKPFLVYEFAAKVAQLFDKNP